MLILGDVDWRFRSECYSLKPEEFDRLFFPSVNSSYRQAKKHCNVCEVRKNCLGEALRTDAEGFWAGTTKSERDKMKRFSTTTKIVVRRKNIRFS